VKNELSLLKKFEDLLIGTKSLGLNWAQSRFIHHLSSFSSCMSIIW